MRTEFGDFVLDTGARQLLRVGTEIHLEPKAFDLLCLLFERRPQAVPKATIRDRLWPDTFVSDGSLTGLVTQVRQALGDSRTEPHFVRTVHGFGYAFCGDIQAEVQLRQAGQPRVMWEGHTFALNEGANIIGRDASAAVQVDMPGVSRRHARIVIERGRATLEDLASKNGTSLNDRLLSAPVPLADGDGIRLGRHLLVYRNTATGVSTQTE